ncbi:hypothetical protein A0130_16440 [Leifsonia xyli]|uniref:hypothetical protein n=1 Tax=Leifsonia xyli TaxID=1575 RepID=UPI0007CDDCCA|nr:hypothetical protein A0130_16440 [Leifsonia xyli]
MKEIAWYVLGFSAAVCALAVGLLLAPEAGDAREASGGLLQHLTPTEWADLVVALLFGLTAFVSGSYLTSRAAAESDDAVVTVELLPAESAA